MRSVLHIKNHRPILLLILNVIDSFKITLAVYLERKFQNSVLYEAYNFTRIRVVELTYYRAVVDYIEEAPRADTMRTRRRVRKHLRNQRV